MGRDGKRRPDRRYDTSTRDAKIIGLRLEGYSLRQIASEVSCSIGTVFHIVHRADS